MNSKKDWSQPDYKGWQDLTAQVGKLPPNQFYFVVTMLAFALIAYLVSDSVLAVFAVVALMLAFALSVFLMHRRYEGDGQEEQDCTTESSDHSRAAEETGEADEGFRLREHDGHDPPSPSGVRTPLESEKKRSANHHPR